MIDSFQTVRSVEPPICLQIIYKIVVANTMVSRREGTMPVCDSDGDRLFQAMAVMLLCFGCRCGGTGVVLHIGAPVRPTTYWHAPNLLLVCAHSAGMAVLQLQHRLVQSHHV